MMFFFFLGPYLPYIAIVETLLGETRERKETELRGRACYVEDTPGQEAANTNLGFKTRAEVFKGSKAVEIQSELHLPLFR